MRESVITLGTFDGVHRGHRALLQQVVTRARALKAEAVALAFGMPPRHVAARPVTAVLLTTLQEKIKLLKALGIDRVHVLVFDRRTAETPPERFFKETILKRFRAREMVVGPRVAFGKARAGRLSLLRKLGAQHNVGIHVVSSIGHGERSVSSRQIRALLEKGDVEGATARLGYPYSVEGHVVGGDKRGRRLGFPTANLDVDPGKILPRGVFWVKVLAGSSSLPLSAAQLKDGADGLCNVGYRPTFSPRGRDIRCEVYLMHGGKDLYGRRLRVVFLRRIRREQRFPSPEALRSQIASDRSTAERWIKGPRRNFFTHAGRIRYNSIRKS